jgi:hypothetical protein
MFELIGGMLLCEKPQELNKTVRDIGKRAAPKLFLYLSALCEFCLNTNAYHTYLFHAYSMTHLPIPTLHSQQP